jgi:protein SCO1/2
MFKKLFIAASVLGLFFSSQTLFASEELSKTKWQAATYLPEGRALKAFHLIGSDGKEYTNAQMTGHWTFLFFGFSNCGTICPVTLSELNKMTTVLTKNQVKEPEIRFVSIDPERDSAQRLKEYVTAFNPRFQGARGSEEEIASLTHELGILAEKIPMSHGQYQMDHSGTLLLINPQGQLRAIFSMPHDAKKIAADFITIQSQTG